MAPHLNRSAPDLVPLGKTERRGLELAALRADLAAMWRDEGRGVVKACHATTVLSVSPSKPAEALLDDLVRERPSRVVLVESAPSLPPEEVEAWATASCFRGPDGESLICSEMIHLNVGSNAQTRVASVIRSLTVGGMPLEILVLSGSPRELPWIEALGPEVDRLLFQSDALDLADCEALWGRTASQAGHPLLEDVTWSALEGWRWAVASRFDGAEAGRLAGLRSVRLRIPGRGAQPQAALLIAGWLMAQLGWRDPARGSTPGEWTLRTHAGEPVHVTIQGDPTAAEAASLLAVEFHFAGPGSPWIWRWSATERGWELAGMPEAGPRVLRALPEAASTPWLRALRRRSPDAVGVAAATLALHLGRA